MQNCIGVGEESSDGYERCCARSRLAGALADAAIASDLASMTQPEPPPPLFSLASATAIAIATLGTADHAVAQATRLVDCSANETVAAAVAAAQPGDTVVVRGVCKETVIIPAEATRLTLDGQGVATISHPTGITTPGPAAHVVYIRGRSITVRGFRISGGVDGVHLSGPAHAVIHGNVISGNKGRGIHIDKGSVGQVYDNVIERNDGGGIHITESSMARIGFLIPPQPQLQPNQIRSNGRYGIFVERGSTARIVGNRIEANDGAGVMLDRSSEADVAANTISGNSGDAVVVSRNSGVNFSSDREGPTDGPNMTDPASRNRGVAVRCDVGGYVAGPLGTLSGIAGIKAFDRTCVDRVITR
jgi:parallel beta-helix repeat protein